MLLDARATLNGVDRTDCTALCHAMESGNSHVVRLLLNADVNTDAYADCEFHGPTTARSLRALCGRW